MVDMYGKWTEEKDYSVYPKEKWCDMDYVAAWIRSVGYEPKTSMENLINMILAHYDNDEFYEDRMYYAVEDNREYPDNLMVFMPDIEAYVEDNGGLEEFDYEC